MMRKIVCKVNSCTSGIVLIPNTALMISNNSFLTFSENKLFVIDKNAEKLAKANDIF